MNRLQRVLLAGSVIVLAAAAGRIALHDPTSQPVSGDQASFTYQALSLQGGDLAYDAGDHERWLDLGWEEQPRGLFVQARDDGWAFAKPLGYSVLLAPALAVAGARGITLVGAGLVIAYAACWYAAGRMRWDRGTAALVAAAATVASHAWLFGFPAHADLFVAVLVGVAALGAARAARAPATSMAWLVLAAAACGLLLTEKLPALVALGPLVAVAVVRAPWRARAAALGAGALVAVVSIAPYLYYSDGASWSAYGGDRFYAISTTPWSGGTVADLTPWQTRDSLTPGFVVDRLQDPDDDLPSAALTYAIGRHTGVATFLPIVAALTVAAAWSAWRRRRGRNPSATNVSEQPQPHGGRQGSEMLASSGVAPLLPTTAEMLMAGAVTLGLVGYAVLYLVLFTDNYFGGGQSIGNRYFLQVSVLVAVLATATGVTSRAARWCSALAAGWALVVLGPHLRQPEEAFYRIERTSVAQRLLPFDGSQAHSWRFECEPAACVPPPLEAYGDS